MRHESPLIVRRLEKTEAYVRQMKTQRLAELDWPVTLRRDNLAVTVDPSTLTPAIYVRKDGLWRRKWILGAPEGLRPLRAEARDGTLRVEYAPDPVSCVTGSAIITLAEDAEEPELYLRRDVTITNPTGSPRLISARVASRYYPEAALSDFTYVSYKWMDRKKNLSSFPYASREYLGPKANNQLFYNYSGGVYLGEAYLDTSLPMVSDVASDDVRLSHFFEFEQPRLLEPQQSVTLAYAVFAGCGGESHIGRLSNVLWRLNWERDPGSFAPRTGIEELRRNLMQVWERTALTGLADHDHFAAHFFSDFYGQFPEGRYTPDQFGCSWLSYDAQKAQHYLLEFRRTGEARYRDYAANIVRFYAYNHYVGSSRLTYAFHTGDWMGTVMPFPERTGWGAPFDGGCIDSLATAEMIYDFLELYAMDRTLFPGDYPREILDDVLRLQQEDGHFRRLYDSTLRPVDKPGWVNQCSEFQTWIPALLELWRLTGDERPLAAARKAGRALAQDVEFNGLFALGGSENDYPDYYDVDGYRTALWAFLALHEATGEPVWRDGAETVQLLGNSMMLGYNTSPKKGSWYERIGWKSRGMIATSYYSYPDYTRTVCTATGNQSVSWVAYLMLRLYHATSKRIYADRAITSMRQVSVIRNEDDLRDSKHRAALLHTIFENHPQIEDEAGLYEEGVVQESFSAFQDLLLYQHRMMEDFGGVSVCAEPEKRHVLGIDAVDIVDCGFGDKEIRFEVRNLLSKPHTTTIRAFGLEPDSQFEIRIGNKRIKCGGKDLLGQGTLPEIALPARGAVAVVLRRLGDKTP